MKTTTTLFTLLIFLSACSKSGERQSHWVHYKAHSDGDLAFVRFLNASGVEVDSNIYNHDFELSIQTTADSVWLHCGVPIVEPLTFNEARIEIDGNSNAAVYNTHRSVAVTGFRFRQ